MEPVATFPDASLPSPDVLRGPPSPAEGGGRACDRSDSGSPRNDLRYGRPDPRLRAFAREQRQSYTRAEDTFWQQVRGRRFHGLKFRRQVPIPPYIADFLCASARLIVELDGEPHETEAPKKVQDLQFRQSAAGKTGCNEDDRSVKIKSLEAAKIMKIKWLVLGCIEAYFCNK